MSLGLVGIAIVIGLGAWSRSKSSNGSRRLMHFSLTIAVTLLAVAAAGAVGKYARQALSGPSSSEVASATERSLQQFRQTPLIGLVLAENPAVEEKFGDAIAADLRAPPTYGPRPIAVVGAEIRQQFILPAVANADDASALEAARRLQEFAIHLQRQDVELCRAFAVSGTDYVSKLDEPGRVLFQRAFAAQEQAYRSGKAQPAPRQPATDEGVGRILARAGYTAADFGPLRDLANLSPAESCAAAIRLYGVPALLPPAGGAIVARYLLTR